MKIALIGSKGMPTRSGGVERHVEELAVRFARHGHDVTVYGRKSYGLSKEATVNGVRVLGMPSIATKNLDAITATFLGTMHILFSNYDIVHYHGIGPASLLWIVKFFKPGTRVVATFHSPDYNHKKWSSFARMYFHIGEWVSCHIPHKTIAISQSLADRARKVHNHTAVYIPNGCAVKAVETTDTLSGFGLESKQYILAVTRLVRHKGMHLLIEAFERAKTEGMKLVIVGGSSHTDEYTEELKQMAESDDRVVLLGERTGKELQELFSHAYLFAQPSVSEGLSISLLEAMGYGVAPLVSDIPENREAVSDAGYTFRSGSVIDLERALNELTQDTTGVKNIGSLARERVLKYYHWDAIATETIGVYEGLLEGGMHHKSKPAQAHR